MPSRFHRARLFCAFLLSFFSFAALAENSPRLYSVELNAVPQVSPSQMTLQWLSDPNATSYTVSRKGFNAQSWTQVASLPGSANSWSDLNVTNGGAYEYQVLKSTSLGYSGSGYVYAGINAQMIENRGKLILVVANTYATQLAAELDQLQKDLIGDGWSVIRHDVSPSATVGSVRSLIQADYFADPSNVKSVFLFGHVPVPYSGNMNPDGHPDHQGAWPADLYYGDMDGTWSDSSVNITTAEKLPNRNVPGDGKFDQSAMPSDIELEVGRVDLSNMTCYANKSPSRSELDLLRQYLNKDHKFRHGQLPLPRRGLICDNFGESSGEAFASSGWRNFSSFFGGSNNVEVPYGGFFPALNSDGYLCAYGTGGGSWYTCNGVGGSDDFAVGDIKAVFTMFLGSYFGDWDNESNFLRAPLGSSTYTLVSAWAGRPHWFIHHMALGQTIGYSAKLTQNNQSGGLYRQQQNYAARGVHVALLGDPSLRLHPVLPPTSVSVAQEANGQVVSWQSSADTNIQGYVLYRAASPLGPFVRISGSSLLNAGSFTDGSGSSGSTYMVRAVKLETSASGTYYNPSEGIFATLGTNPAPSPTAAIPSAPANLTATLVGSNQIKLTWNNTATNESGVKLYRKTGSTGVYSVLALLPAGTASYANAGLDQGVTYWYSVSAYNSSGESAQSNGASGSTPNALPVPAVSLVAPSAATIRVDPSTQGAWQSSYGQDGYWIVGDSAAIPSYATVTPMGNTGVSWTGTANSTSALIGANSTNRITSCWTSSNSLDLQFNFADTNYHRVVFYFLDYDNSGREMTANMYNSATGTLLSGWKVTGFSKGVYVTWDIRGSVTLKIKGVIGSPVLSGIFFGSRLDSSVVRAVISPNGGSFTNAQKVSLTSSTWGASIYYTTDGTTPSATSQFYTAPFTVSSSANVKAIALRSGLSDSVVTSANFTIATAVQPNGTANSVQFLGLNTTRDGTWQGTIGTEGWRLYGFGESIPNYATAAQSGNANWVWEYDTTDAHALQKPTLSTRIASCAYSQSSFSIQLNFSDNKTHKVSLYALDWDLSRRSERVDVIDSSTGATLHTYSLSNFGNGAYLEYALKGRITIRVTNTGPANAVISGLFFDPSVISL